MMNAKFSFIKYYKISAICDEPLHVGSAIGDNSDILINPNDGQPFIQASSISGVFGSYIKNRYTEDIKNKLFGSKENGKSSVAFTDAHFVDAKLERRPKIRIDGKTGTAMDKNMTDVVFISTGSKFNFEIYLMIEKKDELYIGYIDSAICALNNSDILFGGQKNNGCGKIGVDKVESIELDLKNIGDRSLWINDTYKQEIKNYENYKKYNNEEYSTNDYQIEFSADIDSLIIKNDYINCEVQQVANQGNNDVDQTVVKTMVNYNGEKIIPGSSFKGLIRDRISSILQYLNINDKYVNAIFGGEGSNIDKDNTGIAGRVKFGETIIKNEKTKVIRRIKIDKLTGGAFGGALISEMPVCGKITTNIDIKKSSIVDGEYETDICSDAICGLLLLALRDLAIGAISIGGESNIGRGFVKNCKITIKHNNSNMCCVNFNNENAIIDNDYIKRCLRSIADLKRGEVLSV